MQYFVTFAICLSTLCFAAAQAQSNPQAPGQVPVMDGGAGPCALDLTVLGADGKPVYDATVKVHIGYGFAGVRKLDLQAGTNADGKVRFTGLPARVHRPPLEFFASKGALQATLQYDPRDECQAKHEITLQEAKTQPAQ